MTCSMFYLHWASMHTSLVVGRYVIHPHIVSVAPSGALPHSSVISTHLGVATSISLDAFVFGLK